MVEARHAVKKAQGGIGFFRDPDSFKALSRIFPSTAALGNGGKIRVWCPGCSSGEELYSIAILLLEYFGTGNYTNRFQLFGTDISARAIDVARAGVYGQSIEAEVSRERLERFFVRTHAGYQVIKPIRDMCVYGCHDLVNHPPLSRMDLISCRNVLMYFAPPVQQTIVAIFHYALNPNGFLFIGTSESIPSNPDLFTPIDPKYKIYAKKTGISRHITDAALRDVFRLKGGASSGKGLQSVDQELETTEEELQSANQELTALNSELSSRTARFDALSNDLNNLLASCDIPVVILEKDRRIRRFTEQAGKLLNLIPGDLGRRISDIQFNIDIPKLNELVDEAVQKVRVVKREVQDHNGSWYLLSIHPYKAADDTVDGSLLMLFDIDEFKKAREELRSLSSRLTSVQESDNRTVARELHDDITQKLAALALTATTLADHLPDAPDTIRKKLYKLRDDIGKTAGDIHQLSRQLHPSILDDLGLPAALKAECSVFSERHHTPCAFAAENVPDSIPDDVALCLYRIAQEALRNVGKHSKAEKVEMRLMGVDDVIELSIVDIGDGFDLAKVKKSKGVGLISMQERTRMVDGQFSITSEKGKGTSVRVRVPLRKGKNEKANPAAG